MRCNPNRKPPIYYMQGLIKQTRSTQFQRSANLLNQYVPSNWLVLTPRKSYKMFFQNVTRLPFRSSTLCSRGRSHPDRRTLTSTIVIQLHFWQKSTLPL